ncbi:hypothetical protein RI129_010888 [Pyrocoelia pectoralis]|uniref:Uncharacterized protein n=1 Tax=Pyrocoelia pectoralis TaxID=417401 RepID=A0AAN7V2W6_9COLE
MASNNDIVIEVFKKEAQEEADINLLTETENMDICTIEPKKEMEVNLFLAEQHLLFNCEASNENVNKGESTTNEDQVGANYSKSIKRKDPNSLKTNKNNDSEAGNNFPNNEVQCNTNFIEPTEAGDSIFQTDIQNENLEIRPRTSSEGESNIVSSDDDGRFAHDTWENSVSTDSPHEVHEVVETTRSKKEYKETFCVFCESFITSKHFARHLQKKHKKKKAVALLLEQTNAKKRKETISTIRSNGNLLLQKRSGKFIPKKISQTKELSEYTICAYCKGFFKTNYITRHDRKCAVSLKSRNPNLENPKVNSFLFSLNAEYQAYLRTNPLRQELINKLRMDDVGKAVVSDPIVLEYGLRLLQTSKNIKKQIPLARNKMRECARLLLEAKKLLPTSRISTIIDILKPEYIDYLVQSVKIISRYCETERSFVSTSYALVQGKTIKDLIDTANYLILKKDSIIDLDCLNNSTTILNNLNTLAQLVDKNWKSALKDLNVKKSRNKPKKLLPLTKDIMKLRQYCLELGQNAITLLKSNFDRSQYLILLEVTFLLVLLHNRKRVGDIQFIELKNATEATTEQADEILESLSKTEVFLTKFYKKIHTIGKSSKEILVLIPRDVQQFVDVLIKERYKYVNVENKYLFCNPITTDEWINGCYVQNKYAKESGALQRTLIRSNKLRKHIATMMQIMDLRENEIGQLATFMGHTEKTDREFYRLPRDTMMIAKVSKILLKLEMGQLIDCKNKNLEDIDVDINQDVTSNSSSDEEELQTKATGFTISISSNATPPPAPSTSESDNSKQGIPVENKERQLTEVHVKQKWTDDELLLLKTHFAKYMNKNSLYPNTNEMNNFIYNYLKTNRTVPQLRSKIQHLKKN